MHDNPFQSPQVDLTLPDRAAPTRAYVGKLSLASFGVWSGAKLGAFFGAVGGGLLATVLAMIHLQMQLGGPPVNIGSLDFILIGTIGGAICSAALGSLVGLSLGQICEWRRPSTSEAAYWIGAMMSAIGAAIFTTIAAAALFDSEPFNQSEWPIVSILACGAYAAACGFMGGWVSVRRIIAYDLWRRAQTERYGNVVL